MAYSALAIKKPQKYQVAYPTAVVITPTDNTPIGPYAAFYVGVSGTITIALIDGTTVQLTAVAGVFYPIPIQGVNSTGTTATGIVGLG